MALATAIASGSPAPAADYANPHMLVSPATLEGMLARDDVRIIDVRPKPDSLPKTMPAQSRPAPARRVRGSPPRLSSPSVAHEEKNLRPRLCGAE